jgi:hypothetical protein
MYEWKQGTVFQVNGKQKHVNHLKQSPGGRCSLLLYWKFGTTSGEFHKTQVHKHNIHRTTSIGDYRSSVKEPHDLTPHRQVASHVLIQSFGSGERVWRVLDTHTWRRCGESARRRGRRRVWTPRQHLHLARREGAPCGGDRRRRARCSWPPTQH